MPSPTACVIEARRPLFRHPLAWPVLAALLVLTWSSGYIGMRHAGDQADMGIVLFWRTLIAGALLLPFALALGPRPTVRAVADQMLFGVMAVFVYLGGFALAMAKGVPTGLAALISDLLPLAIAGLSQPMLGQALTRRQWTGTAIAAAGVLVASAESLGLGAAPAWAYGLTVAAMLVFAVVSVLHRRRSVPAMPLHQGLCVQMLTGALLFGLIAWSRGAVAPPLTRDFAVGMVWLVLVATYASYSLYYTCLRLYPVVQVSAAVYLSPPVTMIWAALLYGEPLTPLTAASLALTLAGVALTMDRTRRPPS